MTSLNHSFRLCVPTPTRASGVARCVVEGLCATDGVLTEIVVGIPSKELRQAGEP